MTSRARQGQEVSGSRTSCSGLSLDETEKRWSPVNRASCALHLQTHLRLPTVPRGDGAAGSEKAGGGGSGRPSDRGACGGGAGGQVRDSRASRALGRSRGNPGGSQGHGDVALLISSQAKLLLLVHGPHIERQGLSVRGHLVHAFI